MGSALLKSIILSTEYMKFMFFFSIKSRNIDNLLRKLNFIYSILRNVVAVLGFAVIELVLYWNGLCDVSVMLCDISVPLSR